MRILAFCLLGTALGTVLPDKLVRPNPEVYMQLYSAGAPTRKWGKFQCFSVREADQSNVFCDPLDIVNFTGKVDGKYLFGLVYDVNDVVEGCKVVRPAIVTSLNIAGPGLQSPIVVGPFPKDVYSTWLIMPGATLNMDMPNRVQERAVVIYGMDSELRDFRSMDPGYHDNPIACGIIFLNPNTDDFFFEKIKVDEPLQPKTIKASISTTRSPTTTEAPTTQSIGTTTRSYPSTSVWKNTVTQIPWGFFALTIIFSVGTILAALI